MLEMVQTLIVSLLAGLGGLWLAFTFVPGFTLAGSTQDLLIPGVVLAIMIAAVKPLLNLTTVIIKIAVLGVVIGGAVWIFPLMFPTISFSGPADAAWTAALVVGIAVVASIFKK